MKCVLNRRMAFSKIKEEGISHRKVECEKEHQLSRVITRLADASYWRDDLTGYELLAVPHFSAVL